MTLPVGASPPSGFQWAEYFADEFATIDTSLWYRYENTYGDTGFGSLDRLRAQNITADGTLHITTKREVFDGKNYTSGFLSTGRRGAQALPEPVADTFYPREAFFEIRAKARQGQGLTQAFWLRHRAGGGGSVADVSVMENLHAQTPGKTHQVCNLNGGFNSFKVEAFFQDPTTLPEWHTFGVGIWDETTGIRFKFYIDGVLTGSYLETDRTFWDGYADANLWDLSLNTHTGGFFSGDPDDDPLGRLHRNSTPRCAIGYTTTGYPDTCNTSLGGYPIVPWYAADGDAEYEVDYVRVWSLEAAAAVTERTNNFECESDGVVISTANAGCGSNIAPDHAFGGTAYDNAWSAFGTQCALSSVAAAGTSNLGWDSSPTERYGRIYVNKTANPPANLMLARFVTASTDAVHLMIRILSTGELAITDSGFVDRGSAALSNAAHRIEWSAGTGTAAGLVELRVYSGANVHGTTPDFTITSTMATITAWDRVRLGVQFASSQTYSLQWDEMGLSDTDWLGPATTTAVGKDLALVWHTRQAVGDDLQLVWHTAVEGGITYDVRVDWDSDGEFSGPPTVLNSNSGFESNVDGWGTFSGSGTFTHSTAQAFEGVGSGLLTPNGTSSGILAITTSSPAVMPGERYQFSVMVFAPNGAADVRPYIIWQKADGTSAGFVEGADGPVPAGEWVERVITSTVAPSDAATAQLRVNIGGTIPPVTETLHIDKAEFTAIDKHEDITRRTLVRENIEINYGRDQERALNPLASAQGSFEVLNDDELLSPDNTESPLYGLLGPGRDVRMRATLFGTTYSLLRGHLDDYEVLPDISTQSVQFTFLDALAKLAAIEISTELHQGITTGRAVHLILDAAGWPTDLRDIDAGATSIRWWWEDDTDALEALRKIVRSEGTPALLTVDGANTIIFRDRHHRLQRERSLTSQATWHGAGIEPVIAANPTYDAGWKGIINHVSFDVEERDPTVLNDRLERVDGGRAFLSRESEVWASSTTISIADGEIVVVDVGANDPFYAAIVPEVGVDYTVPQGAVQVWLERTSGQSTKIFLKGTSITRVAGLRLRAYPVEVQRTVKVTARDTTSIPRNGLRSMPDDAPWAGEHDARAIAAIILAHRAERLPTLQVRMTGANDTRLTEQLSRDLSDLVTLDTPKSGLNGDHYVERIRHEIGSNHETTFWVERAPSQAVDVLKLDIGQLGVHTLGVEGLNDPQNMFVLDASQLDVGLLAY